MREDEVIMWEDRVIMWEDFRNELLNNDAKVMPLGVMPLGMGHKKNTVV
jgi:hypothetical protein